MPVEELRLVKYVHTCSCFILHVMERRTTNPLSPIFIPECGCIKGKNRTIIYGIRYSPAIHEL